MFLTYPQYSLYKIDSNIKEENNEKLKTKNIPFFSSHQEYEEKCPSLTVFLQPIKQQDNEVIFICVGSAEITGCCLKILEEIKDKKITVLYIRPDLTFLNDKARIQEKITYNILQEYTRSGLFDKIYLFDNLILEKLIGNLTISNYYNKINETIVSSYHMINVFKHIKPIWEINSEIPAEGCRISTIGYFDIEQNKENLFFNFKYTTNKIFYYAFSKTDIDNGDKNLISKIKEQMKEKKEQGAKVSFKVFTTEYDKTLSYVEFFTHITQEESI